jgi:sugar phosphate isomerase/epimerase
MKIGVADYGMNVWDGGLFDLEERLEGLKEIGYNGIERLEAISPSDAVQKATIYKRLGMNFTTCRGPNIQVGLEWTAAFGKEYVWLSAGENSRTVDFDVFCRRANKFAQVCKKWGLKAGLHNHLGQRVENQQELEYFMNKCPGVNLVFDTGHMSGAGGDPIEVIKKYSHRLSMVHLKDVCILDEKNDVWQERLRFCELGSGNNGFDNRTVIEALNEVGYDGWIHIEHDSHLQEPLKDLAISYNYLADAGFKNK